MSAKRSRSTFETDDAGHAPYALFGTPLPDEADSRDQGAYLPLWKQEVRDDKGRKRLHGAFSGGWSAGYFNTVGSKEGWAPSTFVSSRTNRHRDGSAQKQQRVEDYMDEEDLADAAESQRVQTSQAFAGLGSLAQDGARAAGGGLAGLLRSEGNTMGLQLLRRMGWRDGQGIGPKVRRAARLDVGKAAESETHLFAPDSVPMIQFVRKFDRKGLGHRGEERLRSLGRGQGGNGDDEDEDDDDDDDDDDAGAGGGQPPTLLASRKTKAKAARGAFGVGVLNDDGPDEEDPYDMGPKIKYNRVMGMGKKKKKQHKKPSVVANPALNNAPKFVPRTARAGLGLRRCHDGRLPLSGFVLAKVTEDLAALLAEYAPPTVPAGWKSARDPASAPKASVYVSAADAAKTSTLGPRERAAMLGEKALPGKSVFDFISATARDKLVAASGRTDLPPARGEIAGGEHAMSAEERRAALWDRVPKLDRDAAAAALARSATGPYADDETKRRRYRQYLEKQSNPGLPAPDKAAGQSDSDFLQQMNEFYNCARIFKPMTGFMASRFTTSKTAPEPSGGGDRPELLAGPEARAADPAEEAARMGLFGGMTRSVADFFPTRLLCKRFNVKAPAHPRPDGEPAATQPTGVADAWPAPAARRGDNGPPGPAAVERAREMEVDPERNEAVEAKAANADVLRAIFGDSDSE